MRCMACGGEMILMNVVQDDTMAVPGFEHHTFVCSECQDVERRLKPTVPVEPTQAAPVEATQTVPVELTQTVPLEPTQTVPGELTQTVPLEPTYPEPPAATPQDAWAKALEKALAKARSLKERVVNNLVSR